MSFGAFEAWAAEAGVAAPVVAETQNSDYESGVVRIDGLEWHVRTARNTPTKPGAFLAFWCRDAHGATSPFSSGDITGGLLVFVEQHGRRGLFKFTAAHLAELGVTSGRRPGKRGFRVYPAWCVGLNPQASVTQRAQAPAFQEY